MYLWLVINNMACSQSSFFVKIKFLVLNYW
jgi:hypothetical protein